MEAVKVINDLHYNGKTVNERLAFDGLLDQFLAAVEAKDASQAVELLERVAITKGRAKQLATMLLEAPSRAPIHLNADDPRNRGVMHRQNELKFPPIMPACGVPP